MCSVQSWLMGKQPVQVEKVVIPLLTAAVL